MRATRLAAHIFDVAADTVVGAICLAANFFVTAQHGFAAAHINDHIAKFFALHNTIDDRANAVFEFFILAVTLGFAHLLNDHLLAALGGDSAHIYRGDFLGIGVAYLRIGHVLARLRHGHFGLIVFYRIIFDNGTHAGKGGTPGFPVDLYPNIHFRAVARFGRAGQAFFHRLDHEGRVDHFFAGNCLGGLQKL